MLKYYQSTLDLDYTLCFDERGSTIINNNGEPLEQFIRDVILEHNLNYNTVTSIHKIHQCFPNRRRSLGDIYRICKYYYPNCTLEEVLYCLIRLMKTDTIRGSRCGDIRKFVFYPKSHTVNGSQIDAKLEYTSEFRFKDLYNYYN